MPALSGSAKAYKDARLGVARLGASRLDAYSPREWRISIGGVKGAVLGVERRTDILRGSLRIQQTERRYDIASFTLTGGTKPVVGQEVLIGLGEAHWNLVFGGRIQKIRQRWVDPSGKNTWYDCDCVSWDWDLDRWLVTERYVGLSGEAIITDLLLYTGGFTSLHVRSGFPALTIEFRFEPVTRCLDRLADELGAVWYVDPHKDLHFATSESLGYAPETLSETAVHTFRWLASETDYSQIRTRVWCEGVQTQTCADLTTTQTANKFPLVSMGTVVLDGTEYLLTGGELYSPGTECKNWEYWGAIVAGALMDYVLSDKGGVFADESGDPNHVYDAFPGAASANDALYVGHRVAWQDVAFTVVIPAIYDVEMVYEYWNGAWVTLPTKRIPAWTAQGTSLLEFQPPADWVTTTVDSKVAYWVRARLTVVTSMTVQPVVQGTWRGVSVGETEVYISEIPATGYYGKRMWAAIEQSHAVLGTYDSGRAPYSLTGMFSILGGLTAPTHYGDRWETPHQFHIGSGGTARQALPKGTPASVVRYVQDATAMTALQALEGGDGAREGYVQDPALTSSACATRATAEVALYKDPIVTLTYQTRDPCVRPGRSLGVNFANAPNSAMNDTYIIRSVTIADEGALEMWPPWRSVVASTASAQDLIGILRRLEEHAGQRAPR